MKYEVIKEEKLNEGEKEIWYLVEPKNKLMKFIYSQVFFFMYSPHINKKDAIKEAKLRTEGKWDKLIKRDTIHL